MQELQNSSRQQSTRDEVIDRVLEASVRHYDALANTLGETSASPAGVIKAYRELARAHSDWLASLNYVAPVKDQGLTSTELAKKEKRRAQWRASNKRKAAKRKQIVLDMGATALVV